MFMILWVFQYFCSLNILIQTSEMRRLILKPETALKNLQEDKSALVSSSFLHFYIKRRFL